MTEAQVRAQLAELRALHPELLAPLTWTVLRRLLARDERIVVMKHRTGPKARIRAMGDVAVISFKIGLGPREWLFAGAHELAHWLLHEPHDAPTRGYVTRRHRADDPLELEADFFARSLIAGADVVVPWPEPVRPKTTKPRRQQPPWWASLPDPYSLDAPIYTPGPHAEPRYGGRFGESRLAQLIRRGKKKANAPVPPRKPRRFRLGAWEHCDIDGVWWAIHDVSVSFDETGKVRLREVELGSERARRRYFIREDGARRFYHFKRWERRAVTDSILDRQLRDSEAAQRGHRQRQESSA